MPFPLHRSAAGSRRPSGWRAANILLCGIGLPLPPVEGDLNGIRMGSQELTRFGLKEDAMAEVARFIGQFLIKGEAPDGIRRDVIAFRRDYTAEFTTSADRGSRPGILPPHCIRPPGHPV